MVKKTMAETETDTEGVAKPEKSVPVVLPPRLEEFRNALQSEISAARKGGKSSVLNGGKRLAGGGKGYRYRFTIGAGPDIRDDMPAELQIPGREPVSATVLSREGPRITLSLPEDVGASVAKASLRADMTMLLKKLIERIEQSADKENPLGDELIGEAYADCGEPLPTEVAGLNLHQNLAVSSGLGRTVTYIWGPPGTGKTEVIGAIAAQMYRTQKSLLIVSHTNVAVDEAILRTARFLNPEESPENDPGDGTLIRVGEPRKKELEGRPRLLASSYVQEGKALVKEQLATVETQLKTVSAAWEEARFEQTRRQRLEEGVERLTGWEESIATLQVNEFSLQKEIKASLNLELQEKAAALGLAEQMLETERRIVDLKIQLSKFSSKMERLENEGDETDDIEHLEKMWENFQHEIDGYEEELDGFYLSYPGPLPATLVRLQAEVELLTAHTDTARLRKETQRLKKQIQDQLRAESSYLSVLLGSDLPTAPDLDEQLEQLRLQYDLLAGLVRHSTHSGEALEELSAKRDQLLKEKESLERVGEDGEAGVIANATVIATTLTRGFLRDAFQERVFDLVILDEASTAPLPALWAVAGLGKRVVVVGDFRQLPPVVISQDEGALRWLGRDVFASSGMSSAYENGYPPENFIALQIQHRMRPEISKIINETVYDGLLEDAESVTNERALEGWYENEWGRDTPVLVVDSAASDLWVTGKDGSRINLVSAAICAFAAEAMLKKERPALDESGGSRVLIVSPYNPQARLTNQIIQLLKIDKEVVAGTAHAFQGSQAPVVIVDLVNDQPHWRVGMFMPAASDNFKRLFNVAISRAQKRLVVVGDMLYIRKKAAKGTYTRTLMELFERDYPSTEVGQLLELLGKNPELAKERIQREEEALRLAQETALAAEVAANEAQEAQAASAVAEATAAARKETAPKTESAEAKDRELVAQQQVEKAELEAEAAAQQEERASGLAPHRVVKASHFFSQLSKEFRHAQKTVLLLSPDLDDAALSFRGEHIQSAVARGVAFYLLTTPIQDLKESEQEAALQREQLLTGWGVRVLHKKGMLDKAVVVDKSIFWFGSVAPLGALRPETSMFRLRSSALVDEYLDLIDFSKLRQAHSKGELRCPISGHELAWAEGDRGNRLVCPIKGCYYRPIDHPAPIDGEVRCKCGGELTLGQEKERAVWRCVSNPEHFQKLTSMEIELPKMKAVLGDAYPALRAGFDAYKASQQ